MTLLRFLLAIILAGSSVQSAAQSALLDSHQVQRSIYDNDILLTLTVEIDEEGHLAALSLPALAG